LFDLSIFQDILIGLYRNKVVENNYLLNYNFNSLEKITVEEILNNWNFSNYFYKHNLAILFYLEKTSGNNFDINEYFKDKERVFILTSELYSYEDREKYLK
jgi:hypothetical protein